MNDFGVTKHAVRSLAATHVVKRLTVGPVAVIDLTVGGSTFVASASGNSTVQYRSTQHAVHVIGSPYKSYVFRTFPFICFGPSWSILVLFARPPHHDIESAGALVRFIFVCKIANPVKLKLVGRVGVAVVGGVQCRPHSVQRLRWRHWRLAVTGAPWQFGLAETHSHSC